MNRVSAETLSRGDEILVTRDRALSAETYPQEGAELYPARVKRGVISAVVFGVTSRWAGRKRLYTVTTDQGKIREVSSARLFWPNGSVSAEETDLREHEFLAARRAVPAEVARPGVVDEDVVEELRGGEDCTLGEVHRGDCVYPDDERGDAEKTFDVEQAAAEGAAFRREGLGELVDEAVEVSESEAVLEAFLADLRARYPEDVAVVDRAAAAAEVRVDPLAVLRSPALRDRVAGALRSHGFEIAEEVIDEALDTERGA
jgi:hypothetical protein